MKYTYLMEPEKIQKELDNLWNRYRTIINQENPGWEEINEARAILFLTGQVYCERIAVEAIEKRLHLLKIKLSPVEFLGLIDQDSKRLKELREDKLFDSLERYYRIIKGYKNKYVGGKYYLEEEKFLKKYQKTNPNKELKIGYRGSFNKH